MVALEYRDFVRRSDEMASVMEQALFQMGCLVQTRALQAEIRNYAEERRQARQLKPPVPCSTSQVVDVVVEVLAYLTQGTERVCLIADMLGLDPSYGPDDEKFIGSMTERFPFADGEGYSVTAFAQALLERILGEIRRKAE